jgi:kinesin family protein 4/21/27
LKKKQENQSQLLRQKQRSDEAAKRLQEEIQRIKTHKVAGSPWTRYLRQQLSIKHVSRQENFILLINMPTLALG